MPRFMLGFAALSALILGVAPGQQPPAKDPAKKAAPKKQPGKMLDESTLARMKNEYQLTEKTVSILKRPANSADVALSAMKWYLDHPDLALDNTVGWFQACKKLALDAPAGASSYILGYESKIDNTVQPCGVRLPKDFAKLTTPCRVEVVLHGRDDTLQPAKFISHFADAKKTSPNDAVQLEIFGRGTNAFRWAGETDVFEAISAFKDHVKKSKLDAKIDVNRLVIRGFSMGGAGTWHLALHHPGTWVAAQPGAGFTTTHGYAGGLPAKLDEPLEKLLTIYDAVDYAENVREVPVFAYSGGNDKQKLAADLIEKRLKELKAERPDFSGTMTHIVAPGLEHKLPPEWYKKVDAAIAEKIGDRPRDPFPARVDFVTFTLKYPGCEWIEIVGMEEHYRRASVRAERTADVVSLVLDNVRAIRLTAPEGKAWPDKVAVLRAGQRSPTQLDMPKGERDVVLRKLVKGGWRSMSYAAWLAAEEKAPTKRPGQTGPIDDAFTREFCVTGPSKPADNTGVGKAIVAEQTRLEREWRRHMMGKVRPADVFEQTASLVLFGDPGSNPTIAAYLPKLPMTWTAEKIVIKGQGFDARTHYPALVYPHPSTPGRYLVINSGMTFGAKEFKTSNAMLFPKLGDYAVIEAATGDVKLNGLFDEDWK